MNTSVRGTGHGRKYEVYLKNDTNSIYYLDNFTKKIHSKEYTLGKYVQRGDSLYKKADNDTIILIRSDSISYWLYEKIL
ncbi:hypothetical protein QNI19_38590 [Cytophagaceae bacterium DM2B3-1]|uniref:Uncharacterized protein n=1 Tax=Xanthocytophaga flava TaxID=3048013 RepID=A0ABT7CYP5_9BACT|nr:hypothetical protein [Xanthocytophaga flavus]